MERTADSCALTFSDDFHTFTPSGARPRPPSLILFSLDGIAMADPLTSFWILPQGAALGAGFGVTAFSEDDAVRLIREAGYELPPDRDSLQITSGILPHEIDEKHIALGSGPSVVRGLWYPFVRVGV
jgi:hypothetical protein